MDVLGVDLPDVHKKRDTIWPAGFHDLFNFSDRPAALTEVDLAHGLL